MKTMHFFRLLFFALFVTSLTALTGCKKDKENEDEIPTLEVTPLAVNFEAAGGTKTFDIKTAGKWTITGAENASWVAVTPALTGTGNQTITLTAGQSSVANNVTLKVTLFANIFGIEKELTSKNVTVTQGAQPSAELIYGNNFDKENAVKTDDRWPFLDQTEVWKNQTGTGAIGVTYASANVSVRQAGKLSGGYEGASGANKIFFGTAPATFTIQNITLPAGKVNYRIVFGGSYSKSVGTPPVYDNIFKMDLFKVALGNGTEWAENVTYEKIGGDDTKDPFWNYYAVNFTLKAATTALSIKFTANDASGFAIDDVQLTEGVGGQEITFTGGGGPSGETKTVTIPELIAKMTAEQVAVDASSDCVFEAVVVTSKEGGNTTTNQLQVMTPGATTEKNGVTLFGSGKYTNPADAAFTFKAGDKVKVTLKANLAKIVNYKGLYEITGGADTEWVVIEKIGTAAVSPITIPVGNLAAFQAMPVVVKGATSPSAEGVWCEAEKFGQLPFTVGGTPMTVFVQANMSGLAGVPYKTNTTADITGYATVYQDKAQLCPQYVGDVAPFLSDVPMITGFNPATLPFTAAGGALKTTVTTINADGLSITAEATAPYTVTVNGMEVSVTVPENTGTASVTGTLTVKLMKDGAAVSTKTMSLTQPAPGASVGYESSAAFVATVDNSTEGAYTLKTSTVNGASATGVKLGTGSKAGVFTSEAVGVTGDKTLSLYGVAWKDKQGTIYIRVNGGGSINGASSTALISNVGATVNPPFTITATDADRYTFNLTGLTAASTVTISTAPDFTTAENKTTGRAVLFGIQLQ